MTEPDQREKDPVPEGKWVNAVMEKTIIPDRNPLWEEMSAEEWEEVSAERPVEQPVREEEEELEEVRAEMPGRIKYPDFINGGNFHRSC